MEVPVADQEQRRQVEDFVALDQPAIAPRVHPAQAVHRQFEAGQRGPRPAAGSAAVAGEHQQGNAGHGQQTAIGVEVGQFQGGHYTQA
ncbi:hypothetical protein D9M68_511960 [compost metagenome]